MQQQTPSTCRSGLISSHNLSQYKVSTVVSQALVTLTQFYEISGKAASFHKIIEINLLKHQISIHFTFISPNADLHQILAKHITPWLLGCRRCNITSLCWPGQRIPTLAPLCACKLLVIGHNIPINFNKFQGGQHLTITTNS